MVGRRTTVADAPPAAAPLRWPALLSLWLGVSLLLVVWRWHTLDSPPYWDQAFGLWMEANFLAETGFDYTRLRTVEPPGTQGGSRGYVVSVLPTALALLMRSGATTHEVLVTAHVVHLLIGAAAVVGVLVVTRRLAGSWTGAWLAALTLTMPVFSAQVELTGLDVPTAAWATAGMALLAADRQRLAIAACWGAFFMKATGMMFTWAATLVLAAAWLGVRSGWLHGKAPSPATVALAAVSSALQAGIAAWGTMVDVNRQTQVHALFAHFGMFPWWCPDVLMWVLICAAGVAWRLAIVWSRRGRAPWEFSGEDLAAAVAGVVTAGVLSAILVFSFMPRYLVPIVPCLAVLSAWLIRDISRGKRTVRAALLLAVAVCLANQQGQLFPPVAAGVGVEFSRTGAVLERSREYWDDHQQNLNLVRALAEQHANDAIVAGHPFVYFLSLPRLGYVAAPLSGYTINPFTPLVDRFQDLAAVDFSQVPLDAVFVFSPSSWYRYSARWDATPPQGAWTPVYGDGGNDGPLAYRVDWSACGASAPEERERWFVRRLWPWVKPQKRAEACFEYWSRRGSPVEAARAVQDEIDRSGGAAELERQLGLAWLAAEQPDLAVRSWLASQPGAVAALADVAVAAAMPPRAATDAEAWRLTPALEQSLTALQAGDFAAATATWRQSVSQGSARAALWLALLCAAREQHAAAIGYCDAALSQSPSDNESLALAHLSLAASAARLAEAADDAWTQRAAAAFATVCELPPTPQIEQLQGEAHYEAGLMLARQARRAEALRRFRAALALRPSWTAVKSDISRFEESE